METLKRYLRFCLGERERKSEDLPLTFEHNLDLFPKFPPPPPKELLSRRDFYKNSLLHRKFAAPEGATEDKPLYALCRLYEHIMLDNNIGMRNELERFWWTRWPVSNIPDPEEQNEPERYAVLSCIPALLVESFNQRIEIGLRREEPHSIMSLEDQQKWAETPKNFESVPIWTQKIPPLKETLRIPHIIADESQLEKLDDSRASPPFKEKNILIWHPHIHFI